MTEQEAFEEWWNNRLSSMEYRTGKGWANIFWQAACKWQREKDSDICRNDESGRSEGGYFADAILNQGTYDD